MSSHHNQGDSRGESGDGDLVTDEEWDPSRVLLSGHINPEEQRIDNQIRPGSFDDYVGQKSTVENLRIFSQAAQRRGDPLDHILLSGPPGLGKTTMAYILAREMDVPIHTTSGPAIEKKGDLAGLLTNLGEGDVLFIDEIHRLTPTIEENLYPAMEDFKFDVVIGEGAHARSIALDLKPFTLIGATTKTGLLTSPLRDRFGFSARLDFYSESELCEIVKRSAGLLEVEIDDEGAFEIARRCRGTPRIANRLLRRVRDFAQILYDGEVTKAVAGKALSRLGVDDRGLDEMDLRLLHVLVEKFEGQPVGLDTLAAAMGEESHTIEDVYEPFLLQEGFIMRTPRGRLATAMAFRHLGREPIEARL
jgi:holliday junction DNA helicase RuvB